MKFPDFLQILFLGRRGRLLFIKGKAIYEDFYKKNSFVEMRVLEGFSFFNGDRVGALGVKNPALAYF